MGFKLDMHVHTHHSGDNTADPEETVQEAIHRGLDGIVFTEHYSYEASEFAERLREKFAGSIRLFRGVEFSAEEGHCLVLGVNTDRLNIKSATVDELVRVVSDHGGVVIPSHPYRRGHGIAGLVHQVKGITAIEGYNGCNMHAMNVMAMEAANVLGLPVTGGSDAHAPNEVGSCYTLFDEDVTEENLLDLLRAGNYTGIDTRKISRVPWPVWSAGR
jgi:predicted metal-dependent phosphoesterase TrpH